MSSTEIPQLAVFRLALDADTKARQLAVIEQAARAVPTRSPARRRRRWIAAVVVAGLLALPVAGVAAESAVPGDALYPVKRALEPIRSWLDPELAAKHRLDELAVLIERDSDDATIERAIDEASLAVAEADVPELDAELERLIDRVTVRTEPPAGSTDSVAPIDRQIEQEPAIEDSQDRTTDTSAERGDSPSVTEQPALDAPATDPPSTDDSVDADHQPPPTRAPVGDRPSTELDAPALDDPAQPRGDRPRD